MPAILTGGTAAWKKELKKSRCKTQWRQDYNLKKQWDPAVHQRNEEVDTCNWFRSSPKNDTAHRSQKQYDSSFLKERRYSFWINPDSVWDEESDAFSLPSPRHDSLQSDSSFESFLSLLPWGKYLLTPEKPSDRHMQSLTKSSFAYPYSTPEIFNEHPELPLSPHLDDGENYSL